MRSLTLVTLLLMGLTGCATTPSTSTGVGGNVGNYLQNVAASNDQKIVQDVLTRLISLYPPASTRFDLQQATPDYFGTHLVEAMRAKGYAVLEFKPEPAPSTSTNTTAAATTAPLVTGALPLSYIMDQTKGSDLYRLTLLINHEPSLHRVYQLKDGIVYPASYWVRKE